MATFATNNADIARYARRPEDMFWTQLIGMPLAYTVVAFFGIFVTSASNPLFGNVRRLFFPRLVSLSPHLLCALLT